MLKDKTIVPALRMNNRRINQTFFEENLGFKSKREENAFVLMGDTTDSGIKFVLVETPSMRARAVEEPKKLEKVTIKVDNPAEIESLLARGSHYSKLYQGKKGYAFEAISPENDHFLLHAEENVSDLVEIAGPADFTSLDGFEKLSRFTIEQIVINTEKLAETEEFYAALLPEQTVLTFQAAEGPDLQADPETTWDLDSLRFSVDSSFDWAELEQQLAGHFFKDKKETFLQTSDPNKLDLWFEK